MSTILKALKRLETEKEPQPSDTDGSPRTDSFSARKALRRQSAFSFIRSRLVAFATVAVVILAGIVAAIGWIYLQPKRDAETVRATLEQQAKPKRSIASNSIRLSANKTTGFHAQSGVHMPTRQKDLPGRSAGSGNDVPARSTLSSNPSQAIPAKSRQPVSAPSPPLQSNTEPVVGTTAQRVPSRLLHRRPPSKEAAIPEKRPTRSETPDDPNANAQRLTDGRLKVQAIVWAPEPADRMAVVNNKIVREAGTLDGFFIVGIGREAVYVREDGRLFKVPFGKP